MKRCVIGLLLVASLVIASAALPICGDGDCGMSCCRSPAPGPVISKDDGCCRVAKAAAENPLVSDRAASPVKVCATGQSMVLPAGSALSSTGAPAEVRRGHRVEGTRGPGSIPLFILNTSLRI